MGSENSNRSIIFWIFLGLLVWVFSFRGFLTSRFELISDANSYYDHTKFFIENLSQGIYPLWDPFWCNGAPNDFFLRRIGAFNPFYLFILLLKSIGIPYTLSYLWFLGCYYWSGTIAFYLLAMRIYHDRLMAYAGYLMLLFSALGTRLFDSYMMLVTVPLIWFFYFLVAMSQTPRKHFFLGMVLSLVILAGTYIPFYFLIILVFFLSLFCSIYSDQIPGIFGSYSGFLKSNKLLVLSSLMVLIFSFFPIIAFFHNSASGQVAMPIRHGGAGLGHTLTVPHRTLDWGAPEDLLYSSYFSDLRQYKFAVVYVPFFSVIVFVLGWSGRITRLAAFMFLLGVSLFCCILPYGLPFYDFFYRHVFFLKYFRNLHFFIWFFLIPLFIFLVLEHWNMFAQMIQRNSRHQWPLLIYVVCVHLFILIFVWYRKDAVPSTYIMIFLSFIFWVLMVQRRLGGNAWGMAFLTLIVLVQPLQVYHYLSLKADPYLVPYTYDFSYRSLKIENTDLVKPENFPPIKEALYYAAGDYNFVYENINAYALAKYLQNKFILVDHLDPVDRPHISTALLEHNFLTNDNTAIVYKDAWADLKINGNDPHPSFVAQRIRDNSRELKLLAFDANHLRLAMDIPYERFLIYNDSYDPSWRVSVNHHPSKLYEVNGAFKGVWVPEGNSEVEFSYGCWWQYAMNIFLSIFAFILLAGIVWNACIFKPEAQGKR